MTEPRTAYLGHIANSLTADLAIADLRIAELTRTLADVRRMVAGGMTQTVILAVIDAATDAPIVVAE
jgi:hypothetical protein